MKSVATPSVLARLVERLEAVRSDSPRRWGTMTPGEMLCHLGDATDSVLRRGASGTATVVPKGNPFIKWLVLVAPLSWPRGRLKTPESVDPKAGGTKPGNFEADRRRAVEGLRAFATAPAERLAAAHGAFGRMSRKDWMRWAYRHTDHHLRQFGV